MSIQKGKNRVKTGAYAGVLFFVIFLGGCGASDNNDAVGKKEQPSYTQEDIDRIVSEKVTKELKEQKQAEEQTETNISLKKPPFKTVLPDPGKERDKVIEDTTKNVAEKISTPLHDISTAGKTFDKEWEIGRKVESGVSKIKNGAKKVGGKIKETDTWRIHEQKQHIKLNVYGWIEKKTKKLSDN